MENPSDRIRQTVIVPLKKTQRRQIKININFDTKNTMKKFHPFFIIGTGGIILTACLHMFLSLGLSISSIHTTFFVLYPMFLSFLIPGVIFTIKNQKALG